MFCSLLYDMPPFQFGVFCGRRATAEEVEASSGVVLREISEKADVSRGAEVEALHRQLFALQHVDHALHVRVPDHLVSPGVQIELRPWCRPVHHGVVVVLVKVLCHRVQDNPEEEHSHGKQGHEQVAQEHIDFGTQGGSQCTQRTLDIATAWCTVHHRPKDTQCAELLVLLQEFNHVPIQHESPIAEHVEEYGVVLYLVIVQRL